MSPLRPTLTLSGLVGLLVAVLVSAVSVWLVAGKVIPILFPYPTAILFLGVLFAAFSLVEIPMTVFAMRHLLIARPGNRGIVLGLNALFCFFAAVYGVSVLLLTGSLGWGLALCSLAIVRFVASLLFVREPPP
jgi:hypothetical protein